MPILIRGMHQGWLETLPPFPAFTIQWELLAKSLNRNILQMFRNCHLQTAIENRLVQSPFPYPNNRIKLLKNGMV